MSASATNIQAYYGGWRTITSISAYYAGWRTVSEVWVKTGGTWQQSWLNSDPKTYYYYATWSATYRSSGAQRSTTSMYQGYYDATYGQYASWFGFDYADIASKLAIRPVTTALTLRLSSDHWYNGDYSAILGYSRHAGHNSATAPTTQVPGTGLVWAWNGTVGHEETWYGGYYGARDQTKTISLPVGVGDQFRDGNAKGLVLYANNTGHDYYAYFYGATASTSLKPYLTITADYS